MTLATRFAYGHMHAPCGGAPEKDKVVRCTPSMQVHNVAHAHYRRRVRPPPTLAAAFECALDGLLCFICGGAARWRWCMHTWPMVTTRMRRACMVHAWHGMHHSHAHLARARACMGLRRHGACVSYVRAPPVRWWAHVPPVLVARRSGEECGWVWS